MADSIILLDKPAGSTSFQALAPVKRAKNTSKVGHTGTLDKFATGLLIVLTGRMTRLNQLFLGLDKRYTATLRFGEETDTLDPEGDVVKSAPVPPFETIEAQISRFLGKTTQVPPHYSAVHVDGKRAHRVARSGTKVEMPEREVTIHALEILSYDAPQLRLSIHCSKGTYVRSLARDLGEAAGSAAYVEELRRTAIGPYVVEEATSEGELAAGAEGSLREIISRLPGVTVTRASEDGIAKFRHGAAPRSEYFVSDEPLHGTIAVFDEADSLVSVLETTERGYDYRLVVPESSASR